MRSPFAIARHMNPELPGAVPEIPVSDVAAATAYYRDCLSFSLDWIEADIDRLAFRATSAGCFLLARRSARNAATPLRC